MKMTGLEWTYLQRIALDHPYFDTHKLPLTEKEAKAIVEANIKMTGKEFVDSIYSKLGMTRPQEEKKRFTWLRSIGELLTVPPIRKIAIAVLVVLLMTVFFAATPTGRAIADSVIQYFVSLFDDGRVALHRSDNEAAIHPVYSLHDPGDTITLEQKAKDIDIGSFEEFTAATGVQPKVLPFPHKELCYEYDGSVDYLSLYAEYETPKGTVITVQYWNAPDLIFSTETGYTVYETDPSVYYSLDNDGTINIIKIYEDTAFLIITEDIYTVDDFIGILKDK